MLLKDHLEEYTKEQLLQQARNIGITKCSGLRKAALIDRIIECFCTEEMLRDRLTCLTKEQMTLFRKACRMAQDISINEAMDGMQLYIYWLGGFEEPTDRFCVYEEIAGIFGNIDDDAFRTEQKTDMLWEMPFDMVESCILPMERLGLQNWSKSDPLYSSGGVFVHIPILIDEELLYLLKRQMDKEFYIPSAQQIEEICRIGYGQTVMKGNQPAILLTKCQRQM